MDFTRNLNMRINAELTPQAQRVVQQIGGLFSGQGAHGQYGSGGTSGAGGSNAGRVIDDATAAVNENMRRIRSGEEVQAAQHRALAENAKRDAANMTTFGQKAANAFGVVQGGIAKAYQWSRRFLLGISIAMYALQMVTRPIDDLLKRVEQLGLQAVRTFENWGKAALKAAADMQSLQLRTMAIFGSQGAGGFDWLTKFTVGMPFQIKQLGEAFNMLGVYGTNSLVNIKQAMKDVADTAAALEREPKDVAMGLALGAEGAQGGLRRLRQMGITPPELIAHGAVPNKAGTGLSNDPAAFARNAAAIMAVMEQKFGGIASAMRGSWKQMLLDMQDYWLRFTLFLAHSPGFGLLSGIFAGIRDKIAAAFDDGRAQKFADSISNILVNLRPIGNLLLQMIDPAIDRIAAGAQVIADKIKAWMDAGKLQKFLEDALTAAAKFVPLAVQVGNFYIQLKLWSYDLRLVLGQVVAWVDVLWNKIAQGFAWLRGHGAEAKKFGAAATAAEGASADFGKMRGELAQGSAIAQDVVNNAGTWSLKQIEAAQVALKSVKWNDDLKDSMKDVSDARDRAAASRRAADRQANDETEEAGTQAGENFAGAATKGLDGWLGGAGVLDVGNFLANMKHGMSAGDAMAATKARKEAENPPKKDEYYGTVTGVPFAQWPKGAAAPAAAATAPAPDQFPAAPAGAAATPSAATPTAPAGGGGVPSLGGTPPGGGGGHPNAKWWGIGGTAAGAALGYVGWRINRFVQAARKWGWRPGDRVAGHSRDLDARLLQRQSRGGGAGEAAADGEIANPAAERFAQEVAAQTPAGGYSTGVAGRAASATRYTRSGAPGLGVEATGILGRLAPYLRLAGRVLGYGGAAAAGWAAGGSQDTGWRGALGAGGAVLGGAAATPWNPIGGAALAFGGAIGRVGYGFAHDSLKSDRDYWTGYNAQSQTAALQGRMGRQRRAGFNGADMNMIRQGYMPGSGLGSTNKADWLGGSMIGGGAGTYTDRYGTHDYNQQGQDSASLARWAAAGGKTATPYNPAPPSGALQPSGGINNASPTVLTINVNASMTPKQIGDEVANAVAKHRDQTVKEVNRQGAMAVGG